MNLRRLVCVTFGHEYRRHPNPLLRRRNWWRCLVCKDVTHYVKG